MKNGSEQPSAKRFRGMDESNVQFNRGYVQQMPQNSISNSTPQMELNIGANEIGGGPYLASPAGETNNSAACVIATSLQSVYSGDESDGFDAYGFNECAPKAVEVSTYENSSAAYATLKVEYTEMTTAATDLMQPLQNATIDSISGINLQPNHYSYAKTNYDPWEHPLFLAEPDTNKLCKYPRHLVYPGNGCEYSLEEIRGRNYAQLIEGIKARNRPMIEHQNAVQMRQRVEFEERKRQEKHHEQQKRLYEEQQKRLYEEQEKQNEQKRLYEEQQKRMIEEQKERERLAELEVERIRKEQEQNRLAELERQRMQQMKQEQATSYMNQMPSHPQQQNHYQPMQPNRTNQMVPNQSYYGGDANSSTAYNNFSFPMAGQNHMNGTAHPPYRSQQQNAQPYQNHPNRAYQQLNQTPAPYHEPNANHTTDMYKYSPQQQQIPTPQQMQPNQPNMNIVPPIQHMQKPYDQHTSYGYQTHPPYSSPAYSNHSSDYQYQVEQTLTATPLAINENNSNGYSSGLHAEQSKNTAATNANDGYVDDIEEQIEASTIVLENGSAKPQKITIKYRKDKPETFMAAQSTPKTKKSAKTRKPKKMKQQQLAIIDEASIDEPSLPAIEFDETLNESVSNDSYATPNKSFTKSKTGKAKKSKSRKTPKFEASYLQSEESCSNSEFTALYGKYSNEANDGTLANGTARNVRFNFAGATSTPIRNHTNNNHLQSPCSSARATYKSNDSSSKSSTPRQTFRSLRKHTSNLSIQNNTLNENEDSMTSFSMVEPNSFFEAESDDELRQQRIDKAIKTIETHFNKDYIDPFSSELCKALLTKAGFPSHEHNEYYKLSNQLMSKLSNTKHITIGDIRFHIEKEIGRGAYGSVYKGTNSNTGDIVALKYQKPPNTWELYICTEVLQRVKATKLVSLN